MEENSLRHTQHAIDLADPEPMQYLKRFVKTRGYHTELTCSREEWVAAYVGHKSLEAHILLYKLATGLFL